MTANLQPSDQELVEVLYQAKAAPAGLLLQASNPQRARAKLYQCRAKLGDPALARLQFRLCNLPEGNLAITKGQQQQEPIALIDGPEEAEL